MKRSSVSIARNRLRALVTSDRVNCDPAAYEEICRELYGALSKYMELTEDNFQADNLPGLIVRLCTSDYKHTQNGQCQNQNDKVHFIIF